MCCICLGAPIHGFSVDDSVNFLKPQYEWEFTTGLLWKVVGGATPLSYTIAPQIISLKIPPIREWPWGDGTMVFRSRFSLLLEPILNGPEHHFLGLAGAGELEWRSHTQRYVAFFSSGGGFGWLDSKGYEIKGAQGQDFNLNWLIHTGMRYRISDQHQWSLGLYFQHISNRGMNKVNPGINSLGPTLSYSWIY